MQALRTSRAALAVCGTLVLTMPALSASASPSASPETAPASAYDIAIAASPDPASDVGAQALPAAIWAAAALARGVTAANVPHHAMNVMRQGTLMNALMLGGAGALTSQPHHASIDVIFDH